MSLSRPTSPTKGAADEEQLLPTYEQFQTSEANTSDDLPETTATPDEIRDFLVQLLKTKRGLSLDHARRIAAKWTISNGQELRSYPPVMYMDIFGREDGRAVYKEVKTLVYQREIKDLKDKEKIGLWGNVLLAAIVFSVQGLVTWSIFLNAFSTGHWSGLWMILSIVAFIPVSLVSIGVVMSWFPPKSPEERVEGELGDFEKKPSAA